MVLRSQSKSLRCVFILFFLLYFLLLSASAIDFEDKTTTMKLRKWQSLALAHTHTQRHTYTFGRDVRLYAPYTREEIKNL